MSIAKCLCPHAIIVSGMHGKYRDVSRQVFAVLERYTPQVEPVSIDEAFLDVTGSIRLHGSPERMARLIKQQVREETQLTASVGVAPNKFLAKLASDMNKPDGLTVITPDRIDEVLLPLSVERIWGIGPRTAGALAEVGIRTVGDLRRMGEEFLRQRFGDAGGDFWALAHGRDARDVEGDSQAKSIGHEQTFETDLGDPDRVRDVLLEQTEQVAARLRRHQLRARKVTLKIRYGDFETITRSHTMPEATDRTDRLWEAAAAVFDAWAGSHFRPVRLIGMTAGSLGEESSQLGLFADPNEAKARTLDAAVDKINAKFGTVLRRAGH